MTGFQKTVNAQPAPAVEGDFASANPRRSLLAGPGELTAGPNGLIVGRFGFARGSTGQVANNSWGGGIPQRVAFVQRNQPAVITPWLGESTLMVQAGLEVTLFDGGDYWCRFASAVTIGQNVFAALADGKARGGSAAATNTMTAALASNVLTVSVAPASPLLPGAIISGGSITAGTKIIAQLTGTGVGGVGTYSTTTSADQASGTVTATLDVDTGFFVGSVAGNGELAKITTTQPRGY